MELEHNYITKQGNTWSEDRRCLDCSTVISTREEYVHHLGVSHRHVLQFLPAKFRPPAPIEVRILSVLSAHSLKLSRWRKAQRRRCSGGGVRFWIVTPRRRLGRRS